MPYFKKSRKTLSWGAKILPIGTVFAVLGGLIVAYLRWFRPGIAVAATGARSADNAAAPGLDERHAAIHYPPSRERDARSMEQALHEG